MQPFRHSTLHQIAVPSVFRGPREAQFHDLQYLTRTVFTPCLSLIRIESNEKKPTNLDHPYPEILFRMDFVGCCNGLICLGCPPRAQAIVLWNPALRLSKSVRLSEVAFGDSELVSLGFGYDEEADDFKVVRIGVGVEVYSTNSDSWNTIKVGFEFRPLSAKNDAVVGGNPYWDAKVGENVSSYIVWFDVKKMVFKMVLSMNLIELGVEEWTLMDWKGSLAALMCKDGCLYVTVLDKGQKVWYMNHIFRALEMRMYRCLQCSRYGKIIGVCFDGKLFVLDPETGRVKMIEVDKAQMLSFQICEYNESLVAIKGMQSVVVKDDEDEDEVAGPGFFKSYLQIHGGGYVF